MSVKVSDCAAGKMKNYYQLCVTTLIATDGSSVQQAFNSTQYTIGIISRHQGAPEALERVDVALIDYEFDTLFILTTG